MKFCVPVEFGVLEGFCDLFRGRLLLLLYLGGEWV